MIKEDEHNSSVFLVNPISGVHHQLPSLRTIPSFRDYVETRTWKKYGAFAFYSRLVLSTSDINSEECVVAAILGRSTDKIPVLCRPGDKEWNVFRVTDANYGTLTDILFSSGKLYALVKNKYKMGVVATPRMLNFGDESVELKLVYEVNPNYSEINDIVEDHGNYEVSLQECCNSHLLESTCNNEVSLILQRLDLFSSIDNINVENRGNDVEEEENDEGYDGGDNFEGEGGDAVSLYVRKAGANLTGNKTLILHVPIKSVQHASGDEEREGPCEFNIDAEQFLVELEVDDKELEGRIAYEFEKNFATIHEVTVVSRNINLLAARVKSDDTKSGCQLWDNISVISCSRVTSWNLVLSCYFQNENHMEVHNALEAEISDVGNGFPLVLAPDIQDNKREGGFIVNNQDVRAAVGVHNDGLMIMEADIADGDKELSISFFWNMCVYLLLPLLVKQPTLAASVTESLAYHINHQMEDKNVVHALLYEEGFNIEFFEKPEDMSLEVLIESLQTNDDCVAGLEGLEDKSIDSELFGVIRDSWILKPKSVSVTWDWSKVVKEDSKTEIIVVLCKDAEGLSLTASAIESSYFYGQTTTFMITFECKLVCKCLFQVFGYEYNSDIKVQLQINLPSQALYIKRPKPPKEGEEERYEEGSRGKRRQKQAEAEEGEKNK
ncbi:hypothetical protein ACLB2K_041144 [Fragaria x ananassa]